MSRGFVREDDQEEAPFIPPRAPLPDGVPNYVTPRGLAQLHAERAELERQRTEASGSDYDRRRIHAEVDGRLALLQERIVTARLVEPEPGEPTEVRFGHTVTFRFLDGPQRGREHRFTIVGVDEASVRDGRIAFTAPIARALIGLTVGANAGFTQGTDRVRVEVLAIS